MSVIYLVGFQGKMVNLSTSNVYTMKFTYTLVYALVYASNSACVISVVSTQPVPS